jgi:signal transduction histidine kinase
MRFEMPQRPKILLVDDRVDNIIVLERVLKDTNAEFVRASSGNEALALTLDHEFALALVDVQMPEMDGYEMVELMHQSQGDDYLPVIFISAVTHDEFHRTKGIEVGAVDFISMPFTPEVLIGKVNVFLKIYNQRKSVEEAMAVKSQFLSTISHELRTPLTAIKEGIRLVHCKACGDINAEQEELLGIAQRNVDRLARLINDVLDFQKLEANKMRFNMIENNINEVVEEARETVTCQATEKGLHIFTELALDLPEVRFDRDRITQVLTNLVNNAIKFTEQGSITITTANIDGNIEISVQDTGPGIEEDDIGKLFHEFEQLDEKYRKTGGTGLGLAISKEIIQKHNGKIWAKSEFGNGACFSFRLPVMNKTDQTNQPESQEVIQC